MEWEPMPGRPNLIPPLPKGSELIPRTPLKEVDISDLPVPPENWVAAQNTEIAAMAKKRAAQVWDLRQAAILEAASWWAAIVFGTYALGWSVAWVGRGFRRRN
jgi:hypothetical protein